MIEALRDRIDSGTRNNARHVQTLGWAEILAGITAFAADLKRANPTATGALQRHMRLVAARRPLPAAQAAALNALAEAALTPALGPDSHGTHPASLGLAAGVSAIEDQLSSNDLTDEQRGDNLLWLLVIVSDTARERHGVGAVPAKGLDRTPVTSGGPRIAAASSIPSTQSARGSVNSFAVASLVLGILGGSLLAVIFGHVARRQLRRGGGAGATMATVGLVLGYLGIVAAIVFAIALASATR